MNARQLAIIRAARLLQTESVNSILANMTKEELRLADLLTLDRDQYIQKYFRKEVGVSISIGEAARQFELGHVAISRMVSKGLIRKLGRDPQHAQKVLVDKADVHYLSDATHMLKVGQGRKVFNTDGSLYIPKELQLA